MTQERILIVEDERTSARDWRSWFPVGDIEPTAWRGVEALEKDWDLLSFHRYYRY